VGWAGISQPSRPGMSINRWPATDTMGMANKPEPPKPTRWNIYKIAATAVRLGTVEAPDAATAIEKAAAEFRVPANRLMAIQR
jgi:hypothetical protein